MTVCSLSLSVYGQWGSWGAESDEGTRPTIDAGSETSSEERMDDSTISGLTEFVVPIIGKHYDEAPAPKYEPVPANGDGRPSMEEGVVVSPPFLREADVKFKRRIWRRIDVRQKLNKAFTWPRNPVTKNLYELAVEGKVRAYVTDSLASYYTPEDAYKKGTQTEVILRMHPDFPDDITMAENVEVTIPFEWEDIKQLEVMEDWIFDYKHSEFRPRIIAIAPIYTKSIGGLSIDVPLFWLNMKDLRPWLAKSEVYNRYNDAARISWDDLFNHYRLFDSYIVKTSDWDDQYLVNKPEFRQDGLAALLEGEKIKNDLFMFEHDLWEY